MNEKNIIVSTSIMDDMLNDEKMCRLSEFVSEFNEVKHAIADLFVKMEEIIDNDMSQDYTEFTHSSLYGFIMSNFKPEPTNSAQSAISHLANELSFAAVKYNELKEKELQK